MNKLLHPFKINSLELKNRIVSTAHAPSFAHNGHPRERYRLYHEEKAKGGVALTMIGGSTNIAPDSPSVFGQLYAGDDTIIPWFKELSDGVHQYDTAVMCQITHMGRRTAWDDGAWLPVIAPSAVRERAHRAFPKVMEQHDIDRVIADFANAAVRCQEGGFDGIEVLVHSHLLGQFISPKTNLRTDEYGGTLDSRLRIVKQVISAIRAKVGESFVLSLRLTGDELTEGGLSAEDGVNAAIALEATGQVDLFNILVGAPYDDLGLAGWVPPMGMSANQNITVASRIRKAVKVPILHAGGINDIATAHHAVAEGHVDLVGMTRAHIADPHLVKKLQRGHESRIRSCVGLGYCVDRVNQGKFAVCGQNAATGREAILPHIIKPATNKFSVTVIGGGAAGLEAARVCAERGHKVRLLEASNRLGGQLNLASQGTLRKAMYGCLDWLVNEVNRLDVEVVLNHYVEADEVLKAGSDFVFVATGGWPEPPEVSGGEFALSSWDVLSERSPLTGEILLFDEVGDHSGTVTADVLAEHSNLTLLTPDRVLLQDLGPTTSSVALRHLSLKGVEFQCLAELDSIVKSGNRLLVTLRHVLTNELNTRTVDHVVVEHGLLPTDSLYHQLKPYSSNEGQLNQQALIDGHNPFKPVNSEGLFYLARLGDAVTGRNLHAALLDALRVGSSI